MPCTVRPDTTGCSATSASSTTSGAPWRICSGVACVVTATHASPASGECHDSARGFPSGPMRQDTHGTRAGHVSWFTQGAHAPERPGADGHTEARTLPPAS